MSHEQTLNYDRAHVRLLILQTLEKSKNLQTHQESLLSALQQHGYFLNRTELSIELAWLDGSDAVVDRVSGGVHIVLLTPTGEEVVKGMTILDGVRRPSHVNS